MTGAKQCLLNTHGYHTHELTGAEDQGSTSPTQLEETHKLQSLAEEPVTADVW